MTKPITIAEEIQNRFNFNQPETSKIITSMAETIQTAVLKEICGYSADESQRYGKNYQGDISEEIIKSIKTGICKLNPMTLATNTKEIENAMRFYANPENYEEQEYRTPHCHSWWVPAHIEEDKGQKARDILAKYFER